MKSVCIIGDTGRLGGALLTRLTSRNVMTVGVSRKTDVPNTTNYTHIAHDARFESKSLLEKVIAQIGVPDTFIYAAAGIADKPVTDMTNEEMQHLLEINYLSPFRLARALVPHFTQEGVMKNLLRNRSIIFLSSAGIDPKIMLNDSRDIAAYCASKAALAVLGVGMSRELKELGVRINVLAPVYFSESIERTDRAADACITLAENRESGTIIFSR